MDTKMTTAWISSETKVKLFMACAKLTLADGKNHTHDTTIIRALAALERELEKK